MNLEFITKKVAWFTWMFLLAIGLLPHSMAAHPKQSLKHQLELDTINCDWRNLPLQDAFADIQRQSDFYFTYTYETIQHISVSSQEKAIVIADVLRFISAKSGLQFKIVNDLVYVSEGKELQKKKFRINIPSINSIDLELKELQFDLSYAVEPKITSEDKIIRGQVLSEGGKALIGATVRLKETGIGTLTDGKGNFRLEVGSEEKITLIVSYIGYKTVEFRTGGDSVLTIRLRETQIDLDQVVVTGYTTTRPRDHTGAISSIKKDDIANLPVNGIEQVLQGQVPGVQVTRDGTPGGAVSVRIRGYGTIGNNDPLYVIDGVPTKAGLNQFSTTDIENIQVLKDAAATSIYGARAANGVVVINTKSGSSDGIELEFNGSMGVQEAVNLPEMLNTQQYAGLLWQSLQNSGISPANDLFGDGPEPIIPDFLDVEETIPASIPGTHWFDEVFQPALLQSYNLGARSGRGGVKNYTSFGYTRQDGTMEHTGFERFNFRTNSNVKVGRLQIGENLSASVTSTRAVPTNQALGSRMIHTYRINPVIPVRDINGGFAGPVNGVQGALNPLGMNFLDRFDRRVNRRLFGNVFASFELLDGLILKSSAGIDYSDINNKDYEFKYKMGITERGETIFSQSETSIFQYLFNNTIQFKRRFGAHNLSILAGQEAIRYNTNIVGGVSSNFITDNIDFIQLNTGSGQSSNFSGGTSWALLSYFGRVYYQFKDRYLFDASIRRDGSSRFSKNNRFGFFPAFSAGWIMSKERFLQDKRFIDLLKLRLSFGKSGNEEIGDFTSFSTYSSSPWDTYYAIDGSNDKATIGFKPTRIGNPDIQWETTTITNLGIDLRAWKVLDVHLDLFYKRTEDILLQRPTLAIEGQSEAPFVNLGEMENKGLEMSLGYISPVKRDFQFSISGNFSIIRNKVLRLADDVVQLTGLSTNTFSRNLILTVSREGLPLSQFYGHVVEGVFSSQEEVENHADQEGKALGRLKYQDINQDNVIDENDRTIIGNPHPDFMYGLNITSSYKNFDARVFIQGVQGVELYNFTRYYTDFYYDLGNRHARILDAWSTSNTDSDIPRLAAVDVNNELRPSTYFIEDGSFLRIKNVQVGYTFPLANWNQKSIRIYALAQNLWTLTSYEGIDPEVGLVNASDSRRNLDIGVDRGIYPNARTFLAGIDIKL